MVVDSPTFSILNLHSHDPSKIILILNDIMEHYGYLPQEELRLVSEKLGVSMTRIWGLVTFYHYYSLDKPAKYKFKICNGTACHVKGSRQFSQILKDSLEALDPELYQMDHVACLGCCALAPVLELNGKIHGELNGVKVVKLADELSEMES